MPSDVYVYCALAAVALLLGVAIGQYIVTRIALHRVELQAGGSVGANTGSVGANTGAQSVRAYSVFADTAATNALLAAHGPPPAVEGETAYFRCGRDVTALPVVSDPGKSLCWATFVASDDARRLHDDVLQGNVRYLALAGNVLRAWAPMLGAESAAGDGVTLVLGDYQSFAQQSQTCPDGSPAHRLAISLPLPLDGSRPWNELVAALSGSAASKLPFHVWGF
jgi:hypothetical protein